MTARPRENAGRPTARNTRWRPDGAAEIAISICTGATSKLNLEVTEILNPLGADLWRNANFPLPGTVFYAGWYGHIRVLALKAL
jgi:hypothetical protein